MFPISHLLTPVLVALAGSSQRAAPAAVSLGIRMELVESPLAQSQVVRCAAVSELRPGPSRTWCVFYGEVQPDGTGGWEGLRARTGCEEERCDAAPSLKQRILRGSPYLMAEVSLRAGEGNDDGRQLRESVSLRKLSGFSRQGEPAYDRIDRQLVLSIDEGLLTIPLMVANQKEKDAFQVRDVLLRLRASSRSLRPTVAYGEISVGSDTPRADILLDGGIVARTVDGSRTRLSNVVAGERELRVRDLSGREVRRSVTVPKGGTAEVTMELRDATRPALDGGLVPLGSNAQGRTEYWRSRDGAIVVRIPAGKFVMGSPEGEGEPSEHPRREVDVSEYLIDKTEVTWGQYEKFSKSTGTALPEAPLWGNPDDYPATATTWAEAKAFCEWVGGRLPTEAEWEKAARGTDGRRYPWGDPWDPDRCNTRDGGPHRPMGVGVFPGCVSPYGVLDMVGSVWEICQDRWEEGRPDTPSTQNSPQPDSGHARVRRGGSWLDPSETTRPALRQGTDPSWRDVRRGFRCVQNAPD